MLYIKEIKHANLAQSLRETCTDILRVSVKVILQYYNGTIISPRYLSVTQGSIWPGRTAFYEFPHPFVLTQTRTFLRTKSE